MYVIWPAGEASPSVSIKDTDLGLVFKGMPHCSRNSISSNSELATKSINTVDQI